MTLDLDKYLVRDLNGLTFPKGETVASIGWIQLPMRDGKVPYDENGKEITSGEEISTDYPSFVLGSPNYAGAELLLQLLMHSQEYLRVGLDLKWLPAINAVELVFRCRDAQMVLRGEKPRLMIPPVTISPGPSKPASEYFKTQRDTYNAPGCAFSLLDTCTGVAQLTLFNKLEGDKTKARYRRILTSSHQSKLRVS